MKNLQIALAVMLMTVFASQAAMANTTDSDLAYAFGGPVDTMQIELLDSQEMDTTTGEYWDRHFTIGNRGFVVGYHSAHHNFRSGPLQGRRTHLQLTTYRVGVKRSHNNYYVPLWR
jgi:hypothetical protein